jgi:hypothetical protein
MRGSLVPANPPDYLTLVDGEWPCDIDRLETLSTTGCRTGA